MWDIWSLSSVVLCLSFFQAQESGFTQSGINFKKILTYNQPHLVSLVSFIATNETTIHSWKNHIHVSTKSFFHKYEVIPSIPLGWFQVVVVLC